MAEADDKFAELLGLNAKFFAAYQAWSEGQIMLLAGTIDDPDSFNAEGGKTGALGYYPVVNVNGQTIYFPCLARFMATAAGATDPAVIEALLSTSVEAARAASAVARASAESAVAASDQATAAAATAAGAVRNAFDASNGINRWRDAYLRELYDTNPTIPAGLTMAVEGRTRLGATGQLAWQMGVSPHNNPAISTTGGQIDVTHYLDESDYRVGEQVTFRLGLIVADGVTAQILVYGRAVYGGAVISTSAPIEIIGNGQYREVTIGPIAVAAGVMVYTMRALRKAGAGSIAICAAAMVGGNVPRPMSEDRATRYATRRAALASSAATNLALAAGQTIDAVAPPSKNLFNPATVKNDVYILSTTGAEVANAEYVASDFIAVEPEATYSRSHARQMAFYTASRAYLSGLNASGAGGQFVAPAGAAWARFSVIKTTLGAFQVEKGGAITAYEPFGRRLEATLIPAVTASGIADKAVTPEKASFFGKGKNLFDPADPDVTPNRFVDFGTGELRVPSSAGAYTATGFVAVVAGQTYTQSPYNHQLAFYDANKRYVSGIAQLANTTGPRSFVAPAGAAYVRCGMQIEVIGTYQIEQGAAATAYEAYRQAVLAGYIPPITGEMIAARAVATPNLGDKVVTPEKASFFELGKNLANPAAFTAGFYVNSGNGVLTANATYTASGRIPVKPGDVISRSYNHQGAWYRANGTFLSSILTADGPTLTVPADAAFVALTCATVSLPFQVEVAPAPTAFEVYGMKIVPAVLPRTADTANAAQDVLLPRRIYVLTGGAVAGAIEQTNLYFKNLVRGYRGDKLVDCVASYGRQYEECWRIEPGNAGTGYTPPGPFDLTVNITDHSFNILKSARTTITPIVKAGGNPVRLLGVGDSQTRNGLYLLQVAKKLAGVTLQGIRHYANDDARLNREGRGGWTLAQYFTAYGHAAGKDSPFMFPNGVTGANYRGNTEMWKRVVNIAAYPADDYDLNGFQKIARGWADNGPFLYDATGYPTAPQAGWVVFDPTKAAGSRFQTWDGSAWVAAGSQPAAWSFDIAKYLARYGAAFADGLPTHISLLLSANDFQTMTGPQTAAALIAFKTNLDAFIAAARAALPGVKIILNMPTIGATQDAWGMQLGSGQTAAQYDQNMQASMRMLLDSYDTAAIEATGTYVCPFGLVVDPVNGFDTQLEPANIYTANTVRRTNNWVHFNDTVGHPQAGDAVAGLIQATR